MQVSLKQIFTAHGTLVFVYTGTTMSSFVSKSKSQSPALRRMLNGPRSSTPKLTNLPKNAGRCAPNGGNSLALARALDVATFRLNKKCHFIKGIIFALLYFHILFANSRHAANTNLRAAFWIILAALTALS